jgi:hypothetical protein
LFEFNARIEPIAYLILMIGAVGDWISTRIGLSIGLFEGNPVARGLMSSGTWIQTDFLVVLLCIALPFLVNRLSQSRVSKFFLGLPFCAGLAKLTVVAWNISLII